MASDKWKSFERVIAKEIGKWWCDDASAFVRTACSGAWPRKKAHGDVVGAEDSLRESFPFCIEAKCRKGAGGSGEWHLEQMLTRAKHPILEWWYEMSEVDTVKAGKQKMLVFNKQSSLRTAILLVSSNLLDEVEKSLGYAVASPKMTFIINRVEGMPEELVETLVFFKFTDFLEAVPANVFKKGAVDNG